MPNRYLRATYIDSKRINKLSAEAERMFCRLLVHVDDFGRCEGDPDLLLGKLFARKLGLIKPAQIKRWIEELAKHDLLYIYLDDNDLYIQMQRWERGRAKHSKHPEPPRDANICFHVYADANKCPDTDSDTDTDTDTDSVDFSEAEKVDGASVFDRFWRAYPKKVGKDAALKAWKNARGKPRIGQLLEILERHKLTNDWKKDNGQYIPNPATWINQGRWQDEFTKASTRRPGEI